MKIKSFSNGEVFDALYYDFVPNGYENGIKQYMISTVPIPFTYKQVVGSRNSLEGMESSADIIGNIWQTTSYDMRIRTSSDIDFKENAKIKIKGYNKVYQIRAITILNSGARVIASSKNGTLDKSKLEKILYLG